MSFGNPGFRSEPASFGSDRGVLTFAIGANACRKVVREEGGVRALYRGLVTTSAGTSNFSPESSRPPGLTELGCCICIRRRPLCCLQLCIVRAAQDPTHRSRPGAPPAGHPRETRLRRDGRRHFADSESVVGGSLSHEQLWTCLLMLGAAARSSRTRPTCCGGGCRWSVSRVRLSGTSTPGLCKVSAFAPGQYLWHKT